MLCGCHIHSCHVVQVLGPSPNVKAGHTQVVLMPTNPATHTCMLSIPFITTIVETHCTHSLSLSFSHTLSLKCIWVEANAVSASGMEAIVVQCHDCMQDMMQYG
jgi:hypothetical protein